MTYDPGNCWHCKKHLSVPLCGGLDPDYHSSARNALISDYLKQISRAIDAVHHLRKLEIEYIFAKDGLPSPYK